jgi:CBS domain-containing protein
MTVASILAQKGRDVATAGPSDTLARVADQLAARRIGAMVIVDKGGKVCGIVSERDVVREVARSGAAALDLPARQCMTADVVSCSESDTIDQVMSVMTQRRFRHLPVVSKGKLAGIVSIGDVVKRKIEQAERDAASLRDYIATA